MSELQRKRRELDKISKFYATEIRRAKTENKSSDEIDKLVDEFFAETYVIEEEIKALISRGWERKAERLFLPIPPHDEEDMWEVGDVTRRYYLTPAGITKLRGLIREETAARRKAVLEWVTPLVGIIGAITGLLAVVFAMT